MKETVAVSLLDGNGANRAVINAELAQFSPYRCFPMTGEAEELAVLRRMVADLTSLPGGLALYRSGPFLEFMLDHEPQLAQRAIAVVDPHGDGTPIRGLPVVPNIAALPPGVANLFVAETRIVPSLRIERDIPKHINGFFPAMARAYADMVPAHAWINRVRSIYPIHIPDVVIQDNLDILLLDLPARSGQQISVGLSYVHSALKRSSVRFQTLDMDPICYHRFHMHRLFDLGHEPRLSNGVALSTEPWGWNERVWVDPRQWPLLHEFFAEDIDELFEKITAAKPKVLGLSVHQRNEWVARELARRVKAAVPEILILVGGHSCYSDVFGKGAFPEYDYMVIGEADLVVGPLVERLAAGERPANVPGCLSKWDDPSIPFVPGAQAHDLDALGGVTLDLFENFNTMYQSWDGMQMTAIPLTRGCVWSRCTFCAERFAFRSRSPKLYVDEMERVMATGRSNSFFASDSDFGGKPEVLRAMCEEIVRRGLKINFTGQIRLSKSYDLEFFKLMARAGLIHINFGADAFTENMIRRQAKGYTIETLLRNHEDCAKAGIQPMINIVIGAPGETEEDMDETIQFLKTNAKIFPMVTNVNVCILMQNSVYWFQPEKHDIHFYGDKEAIYKKYYFGVPARLWYSTNPYIDKASRTSRFFRLIQGLQAAGIAIGAEVLGNLNDLIAGAGHLEYREFMVDQDLGIGRSPPIDRRLAEAKKRRRTMPVMDHRVFVNHGGNILAFPGDPSVRRLLQDTGVPFWGHHPSTSPVKADAASRQTRSLNLV